MMKKNIILIGFSEHALVVSDIILARGLKIIGYCETEEKKMNPFNINYIGSEKEASVIEKLKSHDWFVSIGHTNIRQKVQLKLETLLDTRPINVIHKTANISSIATLGQGVMLGANCVVNPLARIEDGVICNTNSVIEHECTVGRYSLIGPGAVLSGNVSVGENSLIGSGSVIRKGIKIGKNVVVGAGSVIVKDIPDNSTVVGNPQRFI
jgi:sugar O-acyltransferase (sialic acid O-acetyltransferase NeuD family)